jgi:hypothetical protein
MTEKEEWIKQCVASGKSEEACTLEWTEKQTDTQTYADVVQQLELKKAELKLREDQLRQAIEIANKANDQKKARDAAEKQDLIDRIIIDSNGKVTVDELQDKSLRDLVLIKTFASKQLDSTFASIAALQSEKDQRAKPHLTVGYYDNATKTWKGGVS